MEEINDLPVVTWAVSAGLIIVLNSLLQIQCWLISPSIDDTLYVPILISVLHYV